MAEYWRIKPSVHVMNDTRGPALKHMGVKFLGFHGRAQESLQARMAVDERTTQRFGVLHGGASVFLAESLGSYAAQLTIDTDSQRAVGLDINANHVGPARSGFVVGTATPQHIGGRTQVWSIQIEDGKGRLVCVCRLTMMIVTLSAAEQRPASVSREFLL